MFEYVEKLFDDWLKKIKHYFINLHFWHFLGLLWSNLMKLWGKSPRSLPGRSKNVQHPSESLKTYDNVSSKKHNEYKNRIAKAQSKVILLVEKYRHYLQSMAYDELDRRKVRLVNYFNEARFSVAQIYDYASKRWGDKQ